MINMRVGCKWDRIWSCYNEMASTKSKMPVNVVYKCGGTYLNRPYMSRNTTANNAEL